MSKEKEIQTRNFFEGKTIKRLYCDSINLWTFYFTDDTSIQVEASMISLFPGMTASNSNRFYFVKGYISSEKAEFNDWFDTHEEADEVAKNLSEKYKGCSFNVSHIGKDIPGLTDYHWKWDEYFKAGTRFVHND